MSKGSVSKDMILIGAKAPGELNEEAVLVGGATVPFYLPEAYHPLARSTDEEPMTQAVFGLSRRVNFCSTFCSSMGRGSVMKEERVFAPAPEPIDTQLMREFYEEASSLYRAAPWNICENGDLFGVLIPETSELHFVSIMGNGGECFGLATYRG